MLELQNHELFDIQSLFILLSQRDEAHLLSASAESATQDWLLALSARQGVWLGHCFGRGWRGDVVDGSRTNVETLCEAGWNGLRIQIQYRPLSSWRPLRFCETLGSCAERLALAVLVSCACKSRRVLDAFLVRSCCVLGA